MALRPVVNTGRRQQYVTLTNPGPAVPDGDGGYTQTWTALNPPDWWVEIATATAQRMARITSGLETATHIVTGPYHPGITTKTRIAFGDRTLLVGETFSPDEALVETVCLCVEVIP